MITGSLLVIAGMVISFWGATKFSIYLHLAGWGIAGIGVVVFLVTFSEHYIRLP